MESQLKLRQQKGGGNVMYVCLYQKSDNEPKACRLYVYTLHKSLGVCTV